MSPSHFQDQHSKTNIIINNNDNSSSSNSNALKINKDSHMIKKSRWSSLPSPSSSSSSSATKPLQQQQQQQHEHAHVQQRRHPVIIYTHSPKVIHTDPKDFMALVQKLTGLSRSDQDHHPINKQEATQEEKNKNIVGSFNDDNESSSVITTDEKCGGSGGGDGQVNPSCFVPPNPVFTNIPLFTHNSADFLPSNYSYADSFFFNPSANNMNNRTSISASSSCMQGMNDFCEY